eukprot:TRINITY_DN5559_c3_g1_i1.p1 TRINITY_DN5559_c3_g1~~TRINITY_DN5559_c3_g1_i1.p1  ORF type:complete len:1097 (+),score=117.24 TRINITY_DN5559_c3_g1_i1:77-3367(+)
MRALRVIGLLLQRQRFSSPVPFHITENQQKTFLLDGPRLGRDLGQFQEVLDIVLEALPEIDWGRCRRGDTIVQLLVNQLYARSEPRRDERLRPNDDIEVFMNLPHHDDYWPGADYFAVSDETHRTLFYPEGPDSVPVRFPAGAVVRYDASSLHSSPGFCPASLGPNSVAAGFRAGLRSGTVPHGRVLRTFVRIVAWDPMWILKRHPDVLPLLVAPPARDWQRPGACEADDVQHGCFDAMHPCERCCDLAQGPDGDGSCWAGWMSYRTCCGPASRQWSGCGWRRGVDLWAHEYFSLEPPRLHSAAQCHQRCMEDGRCGGWTYFKESWVPPFCRVPFAVMMSMRRVCILRKSIENSQTQHNGLVWGPRNCEVGKSGCLEEGVDYYGEDFSMTREIPDATTCQAICQTYADCVAFVFFPEEYVGDMSANCIMPMAVITTWRTRCLLKTLPTRGGPDWFFPAGDVLSGSRNCPPAVPWRKLQDSVADELAESPKGSLPLDGDVAKAVDGNYRLDDCATRSPSRIDFDAVYVVSRVLLWLGGIAGLVERDPRRRYSVLLALAGESPRKDRRRDELCGVVEEKSSGGPVEVLCPPHAALAIIVRVEGSPGNGFALCEIEVAVEPVPCHELINERLSIHSHEVRLFPRGEAVRMVSDIGEAAAGGACERRGGSAVVLENLRGAWSTAGTSHPVVCVEPSCAPSACMDTFDAAFDHFRDLSLLSITDPSVEKAADDCVAGGTGETNLTGRFFEASVLVWGVGGQEDVGVIDSHIGIGGAVVMHWSFCAPAFCSDDQAARAAARIAATDGVSPSHLPPSALVEFRRVRQLGRWEDVDLDFLIAGFPRSGTHSLLLNLASHPEVRMTKDELTFNWANVPLAHQVQEYAQHVALDDGEAHDGKPQPLRGGKGEGVALNPRILKLLVRVPGLRLVIAIREPAEWLESLYNLRAFECRLSGGCGVVPSLGDVILRGATFRDVSVDDVLLSRPLRVAAESFLPLGRLLLIEFAQLRERPREFFDRTCSFLGIRPFPQNYTFGRFASEDRLRYTSMGMQVSLCSPELREALDALRARLHAEMEHFQLARLLAASGASWISRRLVLGLTHCD